MLQRSETIIRPTFIYFSGFRTLHENFDSSSVLWFTLPCWIPSQLLRITFGGGFPREHQGITAVLIHARISRSASGLQPSIMNNSPPRLWSRSSSCDLLWWTIHYPGCDQDNRVVTNYHERSPSRLLSISLSCDQVSWIEMWVEKFHLKFSKFMKNINFSYYLYSAMNLTSLLHPLFIYGDYGIISQCYLCLQWWFWWLLMNPKAITDDYNNDVKRNWR